MDCLINKTLQSLPIVLGDRYILNTTFRLQRGCLNSSSDESTFGCKATSRTGGENDEISGSVLS